jgi:hypothetical protein
MKKEKTIDQLEWEFLQLMEPKDELTIKIRKQMAENQKAWNLLVAIFQWGILIFVLIFIIDLISKLVA